ncbi:hypothetical protein OAE31_02920 [Gammaproteobacteria bacterium]|nr:hypothetical protein [Gammaproteobacteria bacterium]
MTKRKTTEQFIKDAREVHGDKYDYSNTVYETAAKKVQIRCIKHDWEFPQTPNDHLSGKGCKKCGEEKRAESKKITFEQFIKRSRKKHGNKYDYSKVILDGVDNNIIIICPIHNEFPQRPANHMRGEGCNDCAIDKRASKKRKPYKEVLKEFIAVHGNNYDYSKVKYENTDKHVLIKCIKHDHEFLQTPYSHSKGMTGCEICKKDAKRKLYIKTKEEFISDAIKVHGKKYDYSKVDYKGAKVNVQIGCSNKLHDYFPQTPDAHINKREGCPICAEEIRNLGFTIEQINKDNIYIDGMLYVINAFDKNENFFKIGITSKTASWRFRGNSEMPYDFEILCEISIGLVDAYEHEQYILEKYKEFKYVPKIYFAGKEEVLSINPLEYDERLKELYLYQKEF